MPCFSNWKMRVVVSLSFVGLLSAAIFAQQEYKSGKVWPEPKVITPGKTDDGPPSRRDCAL